MTTTISKDKFERLIETKVQEELNRILPGLVAEGIRYVLSNLIGEVNIEAPLAESLSNSHKRHALVESNLEMDEYPDMNNGRMYTSADKEILRSRFAEIQEGFGDPASNGSGIIMPDAMIHGGSGQPIPIRKDHITPDLVKAFNTNYRDQMDTMGIKRT